MGIRTEDVINRSLSRLNNTFKWIHKIDVSHISAKEAAEIIFNTLCTNHNHYINACFSGLYTLGCTLRITVLISPRGKLL